MSTETTPEGAVCVWHDEDAACDDCTDLYPEPKDED